MKNSFYLLVLLLLLACESPLIEKIETTHPNGEKNQVSYYQKVDGKEVLVKEKHYHENGVLKMEGAFLNGKREGEWRAYFNTKKLQSVGVFKGGIRTGKTQIYYPNGAVRYEGQYENDQQTGRWKFYNQAGQLVQEKNY